MEPVERRVMLAVNLSGTAGDDTITITATPTATTVTINGTPNVVPVTPTETIVINALGGNDTIDVAGTTIPVTVNGDGGNDQLTFAPVAMNLDAIERQVTFAGGEGQDAAVLNDRSNAFDEEFTVDASLIIRGFFGGLGYAGDTESVTLNSGLGAGMQPGAGSPRRGAPDSSGAVEGSDGSNIINVESLPQTTTLTLNAGGGDDQIHLGPTSMLLDPIEGPVIVNGEGGTDALRLSDQNNAFPDVWDISADTAVRENFGGVTYGTIESLRIDAGLFSADPGTRPGAREGGGDNVFNITALSVPTTVNGGAGNDDFVLGDAGSIAPLAGIPLTLNGQTGIDQVSVDDSFNTAADAYAISADAVARNGTTVFVYGTMERLRLDLGSGGNAVDVNGTSTTVTVFGGAGDDVVRLGAGDLDAVDGRVTVDGEGGNDAIFLDDQTPVTARDYVVSDRDVSVTGLLDMMLTYLGVESMTLRATAGANNVTVEETEPSTPLTLVSGAGNDAVVVNDDATGFAEVTFAAAEELASLDVRSGGRARIAPGGSNVLRLGALTTAGTGALDITNNGAIIDYAGASPLSGVRAQVTTGYAGGAWTGGGVRSSSAAANSGRAVGYGEASALFATFPATFMGQSVDNTTILLRYTRYGDANLDGQVNLQDFNRLAASFGATGTPVWTQGNFNFNDTINLQDFNLLAANFGQTA
jgi:hypothetical protein